MPLYSDNRLVKRFLKGDKEAFGELVRRYQNYVYNLAYRFTSNRADAEELTQEIFIQVMTKLDRFKGDSKFSTWLYRLAANKSVDWLRRKQPDYDPISETDPIDPVTVESLVEAGETRREIESALESLSFEFRAAVLLRDVYGMTYEEIAEDLGITLGTVKSRISRGRAALASALGSEREHR